MFKGSKRGFIFSITFYTLNGLIIVGWVEARNPTKPSLVLGYAIALPNLQKVQFLPVQSITPLISVRTYTFIAEALDSFGKKLQKKLGKVIS